MKNASTNDLACCPLRPLALRTRTNCLVRRGEAVVVAQHIVKVVEDGTLATDEGWAMARDDAGDIYFMVERSAAMDEQVLTEAWAAALQFEQENMEMEQAVRLGIVS